jgi:hypothetical protein
VVCKERFAKPVANRNSRGPIVESGVPELHSLRVKEAKHARIITIESPSKYPPRGHANGPVVGVPVRNTQCPENVFWAVDY